MRTALYKSERNDRSMNAVTVENELHITHVGSDICHACCHIGKLGAREIIYDIWIGASADLHAAMMNRTIGS